MKFKISLAQGQTLANVYSPRAVVQAYQLPFSLPCKSSWQNMLLAHWKTCNIKTCYNVAWMVAPLAPGYWTALLLHPAHLYITNECRISTITLKSQPEFSERTEMALTPHATRSNKPALIHFVSVSLLQANLSKVPLKTHYFCAFHYFCD